MSDGIRLRSRSRAPQRRAAFQALVTIEALARMNGRGIAAKLS